MQARTWVLGIVIILIIALGVYGWVKKDALLALFSPPKEEPAPIVEEPRVKTYASSTLGISFDYAPEFTLNDAYVYTGFSGKPIRGVSVIVPLSMATGTNLSSDSYVSVEQLPRANVCSGDIFVTANVRAVDVSENGVAYSLATSSGAAAGNRYDEWVYALKGSKPCTALRYYVHSTAIGNYPEGSVTAFNEAALLEEFDKVRRTLLLSQ